MSKDGRCCPGWTLLFLVGQIGEGLGWWGIWAFQEGERVIGNLDEIGKCLRILSYLKPSYVQARRDLESQGGQLIQDSGSPVLPRTAVPSVHYYKLNPRDRNLNLESGVYLRLRICNRREGKEASERMNIVLGRKNS